MNAKELETIIKRINNAKNVNESLLARTVELESLICESMVDLGVNELMNGKYYIQEIKSSCGSETSLYLKITNCTSVKLSCNFVDSLRSEYLLWGQYDASYNAPNRSDILEFIVDHKSLLNELAQLGDQ